ncbi:MAG: S8 family serine peptidase [Coriobacteriia bacterium]|nr:S8 family serine peptidase [Coriobacteriia bacterium]
MILSSRPVARAVRLLAAAALLVAVLPPGITGARSPQTVPNSRYQRMPAHATRGVAGPTKLFEPERVVARWTPGVKREQIVAAGRKLGFRIVRESKKLGWALVEPTREGVAPDEIARALTKARLATRARSERVFAPSAILPLPNDPLFPQQWALDNLGQTGGTPDADIDAPEAWMAHGSGSSEVVVAVVDTGVYIGHEDLKDNIWRNPGEIAGNGRDDDRNGYVDDVNGFDFWAYDSTVYDQEDGDQHGTHVAGIIGAAGDNGVGIAGVNHDVTIMPVKFLGPWGGGEYEGAEAIVYAVDNGADVINCSWGGSYSEVIEQALQYAAEHGVVVAVAAGNDSADVDENPEWIYPASSDATCVITVASTDHNDDLSWFSNFGDETVEVAAPGEEVTSTLPYEPVGVFVNDVPFKVAYLAFCLEAIEPAASARQALLASLARLGATTSSRILVVDDSRPGLMGETPGERLAFYTDALAGAGYTSVSTWSTDAKGAPPASALQGRVVVWFTGAVPAGYENAGVLEKAERTALAQYLDNGGRLLLASGDAGVDLYFFDQEWMSRYLHAYPVDWSTWAYTLRGKPKTPFAGISGVLNDRYTSWYEDLWPTGSDPIMPADDTAQVIFEMGGYGPFSGTSMAAPHVAGAAAHILAANPGMSADEVKARIENTADRLPSLTGKVASDGRLNLARVFDAYPGRPAITAPKAGDVLRAGTDSEVRWRPAAGGSVEATFEVELGLPVVAWEDGFEDGDVDGWESVEGPSWDTTTAARSGAYAAWSGDLVPDQYGSFATTITVPGDGGELSWWAMATDTVYAGVVVDDWYWVDVYPGEGWQRGSVQLGSGEHRVAVYYSMDGAATDTGADFIALDDVRITSHEYGSLGTAGAGETSLGFTVPVVDTRDARIRVRANLHGVASGWAYVRGVRISSDFAAPAAPTDLQAADGGDGDALVSWVDPSDSDFDYTRLLRREGADPTGPDDPEAVIVYEGRDGEFHDTGLTDGTEVHYAAYAVDENLNWSDGAYAAVTVTDRIAPDPVEFLEVQMRDGAVVLSWMNPPSWQVSGLRVLRRTDTTPTAFDDPNAFCVFDGSGAVAWDFDAGLLPTGTRVYYAVYAYDASMNVSDPAVTSIVVDTEPPSGTLGFAGIEPQVSVVSGEAMYFTPSRDVTITSDVEGASEMRFDFGEGWSDWEPFASSMRHTLPDIDGPTLVSAMYRDEAGNLLDLYATVYFDKKTPDAPTGVQAFNANYGARLMWEVPDDESVIGWNVYVATSASGPWSCANPDGLVSDPEFFVGGLEAGVKHLFTVTAVDGVGHEGPVSHAVSTIPDEGVVRRFGADRYQTAIELSKASFDSAQTVVLVSGAVFPDAVSASALAGAYDAPVLLTEPQRLTPGVAAEIARLGAANVIIVGGTGAVSDAVKNALPSGLSVERIGGRNRYETSALVAERVKTKLGAAFGGKVFVANGRSFADPLAAAPYAWSQKMPVLLVDTFSVSPAVASFVAGNVSDLYVVGGSAVVDDHVLELLGFPNAERLWGSNRFKTAAATAEFACEQGWASFSRVGIASGRNFPDALAGGPMLGKVGGVMLLTHPLWLSPEAEDALIMHVDQIDKIDLLGGPGAVSDDVHGALVDIMMGL